MPPPLLARLMRGPAPAPAPPEFRRGAVFRGQPAAGPLEYAEIVDVSEDPLGIRHVRFRLVFGYREKAVDAGERTLSAAAFARRFGERIGDGGDGRGTGGTGAKG